MRTPLNSVVMGLRLMQEEILSMFNDNSGESSESDKTSDKTSGFRIELATGCWSSENGNELVHSRKEDVRDVIHLSEQILHSADDAVEVLNDLLNYDKIEMGGLTLETAVVDIWSLIEHVVNEFELPFKTKNIKFELDYSNLVSPEVAVSEQPISANMLPTDVREQRVVCDSMRLSQVIRK